MILGEKMKYDKNEHTKSHRQHPAGADPKVYSYDLQLNLDKNGSSVGISVPWSKVLFCPCYRGCR